MFFFHFGADIRQFYLSLLHMFCFFSALCNSIRGQFQTTPNVLLLWSSFLMSSSFLIFTCKQFLQMSQFIVRVLQVALILGSFHLRLLHSLSCFLQLKGVKHNFYLTSRNMHKTSINIKMPFHRIRWNHMSVNDVVKKTVKQGFGTTSTKRHGSGPSKKLRSSIHYWCGKIDCTHLLVDRRGVCFRISTLLL